MHAEPRGKINQRVTNVVAVADISQLESLQRAEFFLQREIVGERLARMKPVGKRVDHRNVGGGSHFVEYALLVHAGDDAVRATSAMDSRSPSRACVWSRKTTWPPMLWMPTSNVTRVRSDGFSKISARNLPRNVSA